MKPWKAIVSVSSVAAEVTKARPRNASPVARLDLAETDLPVGHLPGTVPGGIEAHRSESLDPQPRLLRGGGQGMSGPEPAAELVLVVAAALTGARLRRSDW